MIKHVLFDGDIIAYRAGFVSQVTEGNKVVALPKAYALGTAKSIIESTCSKIGVDEYSVYLTDADSKNNFRMKIPAIKEYKGNRKGFVRPIHYTAIREYLMSKHGAVTVTGEEADDRLGILQCKYPNTVIASIDKDLLQIPGWHYNMMTHELTEASDPGILKLIRKDGKVKKLTGTGFKWFCAQMLLGDIADNIAGLGRFGNAKVFKVLDEYNSIPELWLKTKELYLENGRTKEELMGNAQLLWIRRKENQLFTESLVEELCSPG